MKKRQFARILHRYVEGKTTAEESQLIETYYNLLLAKSKLPSLQKREEGNEPEKELLDKIWDDIREKERTNIRIARRPRLWRAVAMIIVLLGTSAVIYTLKIRRDQEERVVVARASADKTEKIKPGGNIAVLTLANGKKVLLDSVSDGSLADKAISM
jgi:hypothetical protein